MTSADILIVEDQRIVAKDLEREVAGMGHRVCGIASSGEAALELADRIHPQLVLMDIHLRGTLDGISVAREMKRRYNTPVLYLTGYADDDTIERARDTQPVGFMLKPFRERELKAAIEVALSNGAQRREAQGWYEQVMRSMSDAVVTTDTAGLITFMNLAAEILTGWNFSDARGKDAADVLRFKGTPFSAPIGTFDAFEQDGPVLGWTRHAQLVSREGEELKVEYTVSLIKSGDGVVMGAVATLRDTSRVV
jgi:PAS domain S-box-containing protein